MGYRNRGIVQAFQGKTIESVWKDREFQPERLMFVFTDGTKAYLQTYGDCCSSTWIENVDNLGFKGKFVNLTDDGAAQTDPIDDQEKCEYIQFYGCTFFTEHGRLVIDYRNSSNGYYGGNLELAVEHEEDHTRSWKEVV